MLPIEERIASVAKSAPFPEIHGDSAMTPKHCPAEGDERHDLDSHAIQFLPLDVNDLLHLHPGLLQTVDHLVDLGLNALEDICHHTLLEHQLNVVLFNRSNKRSRHCGPAMGPAS